MINLIDEEKRGVYMLTLKAYAKLNLSLSVTGKRDNGYHELDMVMQNISFFDTVQIKKADDIHISMDKDIVNEKSNTAYIAAKAFCEYTKTRGADINIQKRIPVMSGLGGSSADAAAVLVGLDKLYDTKLDDKIIMALGESVGADVPFSLFGGTARVKGIGEKLTRLNPKKYMYYVVVKPHQGVCTANAFAGFRQTTPIRMDSVEYAVQKGDTDLFNKYSKNALGLAALGLAPDIIKASNALKSVGAKKAFMTGSGSSMFAVFETLGEAQTAAENIEGEFALCGAFFPKDIGIQIIGENNEQI